MKIIGLTGGIASGKSTVVKALERLGAIIIDSDKLAHTIIEPDKPAWKDIVQLFGREILNEDLTINREKLGTLVFNNPDYLKELNRITHPRIMERYKDDLRSIKSRQPDAIVVMEVPLLYETHMDRICDEVWVVWVNRKTQIKRLMKREGLNYEESIKRIDSQMSLDEKARRADLVIDNTHNVKETIVIATKYFNEILSRT